jgi:hypothetical protein
MDNGQPAPDRHFNRRALRCIERFTQYAPFDNEAVRRLTGTDFRIVHELTFLTALRRKREPGKPPYVQPGQVYLAKKCGVTREHICRRTTQLARIGMIRKIRRRPEHGVYKTCLYFVGKVDRWRLGRLLQALSSSPSRVINTSLKQEASCISALKLAAFVPNWMIPPGRSP